MKSRKSLTTIVGACLAAVAAGSLVLFSVFAQNATLGGSTVDSGVQVANPDGSAPVISLPGSSNTGGDGAQNGVPGGTDEALTGPLALLLEPLTPGELLAQLDSPTDSTSAPPSAAPTAPGPGDDAVASVPELIEGGFRIGLDTEPRDVRAAIRALRAQDGGRPTPGDGGNEAPGKSDGAGKGKGKEKSDKPGRGHGAAGDKSNKGGKGHGRTEDRAAKPAKEKKSKAPKAKAPKARSPKPKSKAPKPAHSNGPPARSKSKAPKPATSKAKSPPGHAAGGPPGQSKEKKKS